VPDEILDDVRTGDLAEAWNVQQIRDLIKGLFGYPVKFIKHSGTSASLQVRNLLTGNPAFEILNVAGSAIIRATDSGFTIFKVTTFMDLTYQTSGAPASPGAGTGILRVYVKNDGTIGVKAEGGSEQLLPFGPPPGTTLRYAHILQR